MKVQVPYRDAALWVDLGTDFGMVIRIDMTYADREHAQMTMPAWLGHSVQQVNVMPGMMRALLLEPGASVAALESLWLLEGSRAISDASLAAGLRAREGQVRP